MRGKYGQEDGGYGTVSKLMAPVGKGGYKEKVLWNFDVTDGLNPAAGLILDNAGNLYGTTLGGLDGYGKVFEDYP